MLTVTSTVTHVYVRAHYAKMYQSHLSQYTVQMPTQVIDCLV